MIVNQRADKSERQMMPIYWMNSLISDSHFFISLAKVSIFF